jgi:hypothetical protein
VDLERDPFSHVRMTEEILQKRVKDPVRKTEINGRRNPFSVHTTSFTKKVGTNFASGCDRFGQYSWSTD